MACKDSKIAETSQEVYSVRRNLEAIEKEILPLEKDMQADIVNASFAKTSNDIQKEKHDPLSKRVRKETEQPTRSRPMRQRKIPEKLKYSYHDGRNCIVPGNKVMVLCTEKDLKNSNQDGTRGKSSGTMKAKILLEFCIVKTQEREKRQCTSFALQLQLLTEF